MEHDEIARALALAEDARRRGVLEPARFERVRAYLAALAAGVPGVEPMPPREVFVRLGGLDEAGLAALGPGLPGALGGGRPAHRQAAAPPVAAARPGPAQPIVLGGRYQLEEKLGAGAMGTVFRAIDRVLTRPVAVKLQRVPAAAREVVQQRQARFAREAEVMARVRHPSCVQVFDAGMTDDGAPYLVMELVEGEGLDAVIAANPGGVGARQAAAWGQQLAGGLAACHAAGVVHRDVKPSNVMIARDGTARLTDFGIARDLDGTTLTAAGTTVGTIAYMAPEQLNGHDVDGRADLYGLAATLYEATCGVAPFEAPHPVLVLRRKVDQQLKPLRELRPDTPPAFEAILGKCLEPDRTKRYGGAPTLTLEFGRFLADEPVEALQRTPRARRPRRRRARFAAPLGIAAAVVAATAAGVAAFRGAGKAKAEDRGAGEVAVVASPGAGEFAALPPAAQPPPAAPPPPPPAAAPTAQSGDGAAVGPDGASPIVVREGKVFNARDGSELIWIPPGTFIMGSELEVNEKPERYVTLTKGYYIGKYEVTWGQFDRFCDATGRERIKREWQSGGTGPLSDDHPIDSVPKFLALAYVRWAGARLPTEAEWEYAARGTDGRTYPWGGGFPKGSMHLANVADASLARALPSLSVESVQLDYDDGYVAPWPARFEGHDISPFGAVNMGGNVAEWVADRLTAAECRISVDPLGTDPQLLARGGSWIWSAWSARVSCRLKEFSPLHAVGLRIAH